MIAPSQHARVYPEAVNSSRPYKGLPLGTILDLIDQAQAAMRSAGRAGDPAGYLLAEAREEALQYEWDALSTAELRGQRR